MFCTFCGKELKEGTKFCPYCGNSVASKSNNIEKTQQVPKSSKKIPIVIILLVGFIALLAIGVKVLSDKPASGGSTVEEPKKAGILSSKKYLAVVKNESEKYGYINEKGEEVIPCQFDYATDFCEEGTAFVAKEVSQDAYKYGMIDTSGKMIVDYIYSDVYEFEDNDLAIVVKGGEIGDDGYEKFLSGYINKKGKEVIPCQYTSASRFSNGYAAVCDENYKYGYINEKGDVVIPFQYDYAGLFDKEGHAMVYDDGKEGYSCIDEKGEVLFSNQNVDEDSACDNGLYTAYYEKMDDEGEEEYKFYFINAKGEKVFNKEFALAKGFNNGYACVAESFDDGPWGVINEEGEFIIPYKYDSIQNFNEEGYCVVGMEGESEEEDEDYTTYRYGVIDESGEEVLGCKYGWLDYIGEGLWVCSNADLSSDVALINKEEKVLLPYQDALINELGDNGWIAVGKCVSGYYDDEEDTRVYNYSYIDKEGQTVRELPSGYVYAGTFKKTK